MVPHLQIMRDFYFSDILNTSKKHSIRLRKRLIAHNHYPVHIIYGLYYKDS